MPPKTTVIKKRKTERAPQVDKLLIPAIGVCIALLGYQFYSGIAEGIIARIDPLDDVGLREVFFAEVTGKQSYAVLCHDADSKAPISSVFSDAFSGGSSPAIFRILDCNYVLPESGKLLPRDLSLISGKGRRSLSRGLLASPSRYECGVVICALLVVGLSLFVGGFRFLVQVNSSILTYYYSF